MSNVFLSQPKIMPPNPLCKTIFFLSYSINDMQKIIFKRQLKPEEMKTKQMLSEGVKRPPDLPI